MKAEINEYLFLEFGVDGDISQVSDSWPFALALVGEFDGEAVFEFASEGEAFYAVRGRSLTYYPKDGFSIDDLRFQLRGSRWIAEHGPVDLNTSRGEHPVIPRVPERKAAIEALVRSFRPADPPAILEGLFLEKSKAYLALVRFSDEPVMHVLGDGFRVSDIPLSTTSRWRILSREVGRVLEDRRGGG